MAGEPIDRGPRVFISFAGPDQESARRLKHDLASCGITAFFAPEDLPPGGNIPAWLSEQLAESDYFVLLVSVASVQRPWVEVEWSAALAREIHERRLFLFLLRLDQTPPPALLWARHYLDAFHNWEAAVDQLVQTWRRDFETRRGGMHVLPAPGLTVTAPNATIGLYVVNDALAVQHYLRVAPDLTGWQLYAQIRVQLNLRDQVEAFNGQIGIKLTYALSHGSQPLCSDDVPLVDQGVHDGDRLILRVTVNPFMPGEPATSIAFRGTHDDLPRPVLRALMHEAFRHLLPVSAHARF